MLMSLIAFSENLFSLPGYWATSNFISSNSSFHFLKADTPPPANGNIKRFAIILFSLISLFSISKFFDINSPFNLFAVSIS